MGYLQESTYDLFDADFWGGIRPFGILVFYKLAQQNLVTLQWLQLIIALSSAGLMLFALRKTLQSQTACIVTGLAITCMNFASDVFMWHRMVLSESLSFSLFQISLSLTLLALCSYRCDERRCGLYSIAAIFSWIVWSNTPRC